MSSGQRPVFEEFTPFFALGGFFDSLISFLQQLGHVSFQEQDIRDLAEKAQRRSVNKNISHRRSAILLLQEMVVNKSCKSPAHHNVLEMPWAVTYCDL